MSEYRNATGTRKTLTFDDGGTVTLWLNPDVARLDELVDLVCENDEIEGTTVSCPNPEDPRGIEPDGCPGKVVVEPAKFDSAVDFIDALAGHDHGTLRCTKCGEPIIGIVGDGDMKSRRKGVYPWR